MLVIKHSSLPISLIFYNLGPSRDSSYITQPVPFSSYCFTSTEATYSLLGTGNQSHQQLCTQQRKVFHSSDLPHWIFKGYFFVSTTLAWNHLDNRTVQFKSWTVSRRPCHQPNSSSCPEHAGFSCCTNARRLDVWNVTHRYRCTMCQVTSQTGTFVSNNYVRCQDNYKLNLPNGKIRKQIAYNCGVLNAVTLPMHCPIREICTWHLQLFFTR